MKQILKFIRSISLLNWCFRRIIKWNYSIAKKLFKFNSEHLIMSGTENIKLPNGSQFKIFSKGDDFIPNQLFWHGYNGYEKSIEVFYQISLFSSIIIDIGANIGYYSLVAAAANPKSKVYAFEPVDRIRKRFEKQIEINKFQNIYIDKRVVSNYNGEIPFFIPIGNNMVFAASVKKGWVSQVEEEILDCITLDSYFINNNFGKIDLVKMDCEFHEFEILQGMKDIIKNDEPAILMEVLMPEADGVKGLIENSCYVETLEQLIKEFGYFPYLIYQGALMKISKLEYNKFDRNYLFVKFNSNKTFNLIPEFVEEYIKDRNKKR
jgi:FkbM family methyltransferase